MNDLRFAIGILSWKGYDSLENSLASYQKNGLSNLTNNKFVCLPEYTEQGIKIVEKYHYKPILIKENLGILEGFKKLAEKMPQGPILLLENDLELVEDKRKTYEKLKTSIEFLTKYKVIQVRLRSILFPGEPFEGLRKYKQYWSNNKISQIKRFFRPWKARKLIGTSPYILENPEQIHPNFIEKISEGFYLVPSSVITWANLAILVDRDTYLKKIIQKAEQTKSKKFINGYKNIEIELNSSWWRNKEFKILVTSGLFKHNRLSYRGY